MTPGLIHALRTCALAALVVVSGCASSASGLPDQTKVDADTSYETALYKCRKLQPGRLNQRMKLPPESLRVSQCLRKLGWQPDGSRYMPPAS